MYGRGAVAMGLLQCSYLPSGLRGSRLGLRGGGLSSSSGSRGSRLARLLVALAEAVDATRRIDQLLRPRVEGVAGRADVDREIAAGGLRDEGIAARAGHAGRGVVGVNAFLHGGPGKLASDVPVCY